MSDKPRLLDLFCGAGGSAKGYQRAGFYVVGVDIKPQPHYCGDEFHQADALAFPLEGYDAYHASPPCQAYSKNCQYWRKLGYEYPRLVEPTRGILVSANKPYVIENVKNAPLINPHVLNGAMFGLLLQKTRFFEANFEIPFTLMPQNIRPVRVGRPVRDGQVISPVGHFANRKYAEKQMGIDWMTKQELTQAIPPVYTEYIGKYLMGALNV